jgi:hypothetical protein
MDEQNNEEDLTTAEDGEKLESCVGSSSLGSRKSNGGGVKTVAEIGTTSVDSSSSSSSSVDSFELGRADALSAAALKLPPPPPVEDNVEDLFAATSSYHDNNDEVNQAGHVVRNFNGTVSGLTYKFSMKSTPMSRRKTSS